MKIVDKVDRKIIMQSGIGTKPYTAPDFKSAQSANKKVYENKLPSELIDYLVDTPDTEDTVVVSEEAKRSAQDFQSKLDEMRNKMRELREGLERAREAGEGAAEAWKEKIKCLQIAMRIMSGNKVPEADHRFLQEKDPDLYGKAITMRTEKIDPKEHDRLSEDEEEDGIVGDPESAGVESQEAEGSADADNTAASADSDIS